MRPSRSAKLFFGTIALTLVLLSACAPVESIPTQTPTVAGAMPWMDASLPPEARARLLLEAMTLEEKITLATGDSAGADGGYVGHISAIPRLGIPELNMKDGPAGVGNGATGVTAFPAPITVAASWDAALMERYGAAMGEEQRGKGVNVHLAPMMNLVRVPRAGRNFEGYGEDPYLAARMAEAAVRGIQSNGIIAVAKHYIGNEQEILRGSISSEIDMRTLHEIYLPPFQAAAEAGVGAIMCAYNRVNGVYACENPITQNDILKGELGFSGWIMSDWGATHSTVESILGGLDMEMPGGVFFGKSIQGMVENGRISMEQLDRMALRILTTMFRLGLFDRPPVGWPSANVRSEAHTALARAAAAQGMVLLKNDDGILPLDGNRIRSIAVFGAAAEVSPIVVGVGSAYVNPPYVISPLQGIIERARNAVKVRYFDVSLQIGRPIPAERFQTPDGQTGLLAEYFDNPDLAGTARASRIEPTAVDFSWEAIAPTPGLPPKNWSARWSGVLTPPVTGMYNLALSCAAKCRLYVNDELVLDAWQGDAERPMLTRMRLVSHKAYPFRVEYSQPDETGDVHLTWYTPEANPLRDARAIAAQADVTIVVAGVNSTEGSDRQGLNVPEEDMIRAVASANPQTIVVVYGPAQVLMPWVDDVKAILLGWIPGQEAGHALADVLFGDVNPSGRLPVTFAVDEADYPANAPEMYPGDGQRVLYAEGLRVGYRHFDSRSIAPLFPFGHGLSYTAFTYSNLRVEPQQIGADGAGRVKVDVANSGPRAGAEVVQLYLGFPAEAGEPPRQLKGFQKLTLQPGAMQTVTFTLTPAEFSIWSAGLEDWVAVPGTYQVMVGSSSRDIRLRGTLEVKGGPLDGETFQAEQAMLSGGAKKSTNHAGFTGKGFVGGLAQTGAAVSFTVNVEEEGIYNLVLRYASTMRPGEQDTPRTLSLYVNGSRIGQVSLPNLANWEMWDYEATPVSLHAGVNTITYQYEPGNSGDVHLDALLLVRVAEPASMPRGADGEASLWRFWLPLVLGAAVIATIVPLWVWKKSRP